jgi:hypothetical protein
MNNDQDISLILAAAIRYSFYRSSYIVPVIQDFLRRHIDNKFIKRDMRLYIADIKNYLKDLKDENRIHVKDYDVKSWESLLDELEKAYNA